MDVVNPLTVVVTQMIQRHITKITEMQFSSEKRSTELSC